eukprot:c11677_g1_i1.p1 GENE.c11677_g1_i1~~c11677_g1_i1.p1  ORF type:complete len:238 (+),score=49.64 c11677_g1_i1:55-768(+)
MTDTDEHKPKKSKTVPIFGYWNIRGLAEATRMIFHYANIEFEDRRYQQGEAPEFDKTCWTSVKATVLGDYPSPNLPYLIDGETVMTQSNAIARYVGRKAGLSPTSEDEARQVDLLLDELADIRGTITRQSYNRDFETLKPAFTETSRKNFGVLEKFLGNGPWFAGQHLSIADFVAYETIQAALGILGLDFLSSFPKLQDFTQRFRQIPELAAYLASETHTKTQFNNKHSYTSVHGIC